MHDFLYQEPVTIKLAAIHLTYGSLVPEIRKSFAMANGMRAALFSANSAGACPACKGPGAGHDGGRVVFQGPPAELVHAANSLTGEHLAEVLG